METVMLLERAVAECGIDLGPFKLAHLGSKVHRPQGFPGQAFQGYAFAAEGELQVSPGLGEPANRGPRQAKLAGVEEGEAL
jgi:hypothetical protein